MENIQVESLDNGVGVVRLHRPQAMNALNSDLMRELLEALTAFDNDNTRGCMVVTGSDKAFAAGADIKEMDSQSLVEVMNSDMIGIYDRLREIKKPVIAAVGGVALGGGCELAMACDMIIASENARFGQPEINLGIIPGAGGTQRLTRAVGKTIAMEMILNNRWLSAQEAYQFGLVNRVYSPEVYYDEAIRIAAEIAARAPVAIALAKEAVNSAFELSLAEGIHLERRLFHILFSTEDKKEGMQAFIEKREAKWQGK